MNFGQGVALALTFQASLASDHKIWPKIGGNCTWELKSMVGNMSIPMYFMQSKKLLMLRSALNFNNLTNTKYPPDLRMSKLSRVCLVKKDTTF